MYSTPSIFALAAAFLSALPAGQAAMYTKNSPVLQVNAGNYDRLIAKSNHTSIVEFFAPWCGHCQNLKPAYEKAARSLAGLAHVAAVDCDDEANKPLCGKMGVQGFPTLKIVRPGKKYGKPVVEAYEGPRTATGIVDAVIDHINNHVTKLTDKDVDVFLGTEDDSKPKALLVTDKGTISPLLKSIAIDFLGVVSIGQIRNKNTQTVERLAVEKFPTLILFPGGGKEPVTYDGELKREEIVNFLSQAGAPNPDPTAETANKTKKDKKDKKDKNDASDSKPKAKKQAPAKKSEEPEPETETDSKTETEAESASATAQTAPVIVESAVPIPTINSPEKLVKECLSDKSNTCVLAFVPSSTSEKAQQALDALAELAYKHAQSKRHLFPFFAVPDSNSARASVLEKLDLSGDVELVAVNARRGWWRHFGGEDVSQAAIETWIDTIRMGEGAKNKLPEGLLVLAAEETLTSSSDTPSETETAETTESVSTESSESAEATEATEPVASPPASESPEQTAETKSTEEIKHEEL